MSTTFQGFPATVFAWFDGLEQDNSRAYFTATRERYEVEVRGGLEALLEELRALDRKLLEAARGDPVVRTLMTAPGVGAIVALTFKSAVDDPGRFRRARDVGP